MCGIAGIIHKGKSTNVGGEMQQMLQSLKHRGPDSTGYALYGTGGTQDYILRFKVGENVKEGSSAIMEDASLYEKRRNEVKFRSCKRKRFFNNFRPFFSCKRLFEKIH